MFFADQNPGLNNSNITEEQKRDIVKKLILLDNIAGSVAKKEIEKYNDILVQQGKGNFIVMQFEVSLFIHFWKIEFESLLEKTDTGIAVFLNNMNLLDEILVGFFKDGLITFDDLVTTIISNYK
jgi:hypothetical protein